LRVTRLPTDYRETLDSKFATADTATRLPAWVAYDRKVALFIATYQYLQVSYAAMLCYGCVGIAFLCLLQGECSIIIIRELAIT
jgi:hypothetical protein